MATLLCWSLGLEEQGRGDPLWDCKAYFWGWSLGRNRECWRFPRVTSGSDLEALGTVWCRGTQGLVNCTRLPRAPGTAASPWAVLGRRGAGSSATGAGRGCWRGGGGKVGVCLPISRPRRHLWLYNWLSQRFLSSYLILGERRGEGSSVGQEATTGEGQGEDRVRDRKGKLIKKGYSEESEPGQWSAKNQPAANLP